MEQAILVLENRLTQVKRKLEGEIGSVVRTLDLLSTYNASVERLENEIIDLEAGLTRLRESV